jgi:hypothetical protein
VCDYVKKGALSNAPFVCYPSARNLELGIWSLDWLVVLNKKGIGFQFQFLTNKKADCFRIPTPQLQFFRWLHYIAAIVASALMFVGVEALHEWWKLCYDVSHVEIFLV